MPLLYGDYKQLYVDDNVLIFSRTYMGEVVIVGLNNSPERFSIEVDGRKIEIEPYGYTIVNGKH
jgi:hypothetical protein